MEENHSKIGYSFSDPSLESLAYTHASCNADHGDNQRLEFLGDAALDLIIADALYHRLPAQDEGALDRTRASLVNGRSLAAKAKELDLGAHIRVSESQRRHHPEPSESMLEDALEALIGAIYLDGGLKATRDFVSRIFKNELESIEASSDQRNPKSELQEWAQKHCAGALPEYTLVRSEGPDHKRRYTASVQLEGKPIGKGEGSSIKVAEMAAAEIALEAIEKNA
ncbi:ribonuclease III [Coraliomargarita sinensis]|uniref:Ribonuclease 3 n=1 Tax=Coraliomargarita sinensis TaxID=2174842 RepID=A0A317ZKI1_9BACT|nr:ribonuclease III [Coraliomargarita sinensis]PXA04319.1 ribonuclease III [Coraliomargarita sinensis]